MVIVVEQNILIKATRSKMSLPKALAMATLSRMAMRGMTMMAEPSCEAISPNPMVVSVPLSERLKLKYLD